LLLNGKALCRPARISSRNAIHVHLIIMAAFGPLLGVVVGALLTWLLTRQGRRDDRRRDAWAGWAQQAYRLMITRRQIVEQCWTDCNGDNGHPAEVRPALQQKLRTRIVQEVQSDSQLHSALALVLLAETSSNRRHQAREFTNLLSRDVEIEPDFHPAMIRIHHERYLLALQLTLDALLGRFAEVGTTTQVTAWFKEKYEQLGEKGEPTGEIDGATGGAACR
jgi:hypothetical protein